MLEFINYLTCTHDGFAQLVMFSNSYALALIIWSWFGHRKLERQLEDKNRELEAHGNTVHQLRRELKEAREGPKPALPGSPGISEETTLPDNSIPDTRTAAPVGECVDGGVL